MKFVIYLSCIAILFASCRGVRQNAALPTDADHLPMAYAVSPKGLVNETPLTTTESKNPVNTDVAQTDMDDAPTEVASSAVSKTTTQKVHSFTQWKEMAASGELKMSKKDIKTLNKLDKKYGGNFEKFKADTFEFTTKAKIIAGVGLLGLLLALITGSWFGAFLFILAALGFILRFLGVIEF